MAVPRIVVLADLHCIKMTELLTLYLQYPKGLGKTVTELDISHAAGVFEKTKFSMVLPEVEEKLKTLCGGDVKHVVLFGIEVNLIVHTYAYTCSINRPFTNIYFML